MALGLIGGMLTAGLGKAGEKYIDLEEKRRAEEAQNTAAMQRMEYGQELQQKGKIQEEERAKAKLQEFQTAAAAWRVANPKATQAQFAAHFADTEYAPLIGPSLQAGGLINQEEAQKMTAKYQADSLKLQQEREARAAAHEKRMEGIAAQSAAQAQERWRFEKGKLEEADLERKDKRALTNSYFDLRDKDPFGAALVQDKLKVKYGVDVGEKTPEGAKVKEKIIDPKTGIEREREYHEPGVTEAAKADKIISMSAPTSEKYRDHTVYKMPDGNLVVRAGNRIWPVPKSETDKAPTKPLEGGALAGATGTWNETPGAPAAPVAPTATRLDWKTGTPTTPQELTGMIYAAESAGDTERLNELYALQASGKINAPGRKGLLELASRATADQGGGD